MSEQRGRGRSFEREVRRAFRGAGLAASPGAPVLVAVSGGADSSALLLALDAVLRSGSSAAPLTAAYVDHGMRSAAERTAEQALLADLCRTLSVPLICLAVDVVAERQRHRLSWEDAARRCRYAALGETAQQLGARVVATGHTSDDQVETVLLRLLRGTGVRGLRGMAPLSTPWGENGPLLWRPLLRLSRADTERYCRARGRQWVSDSSNASARFRRNRVRAELIPLLRDISPGATAAVRRLADQTRALSTWLDAEVADVLAELWSQDADGGRLARPARPLPPFLAAQVVATVVGMLCGGGGAPSERAVEAVRDLWLGGAGRRLSLPGGLQAESSYAGVRFYRGSTPGRIMWREVKWQLDEGTMVLPGWRVSVGSASGAGCEQACRSGASAEEIGGLVAYVAVEHGPAELSVGFWRAGERMRPAGMEHDKKLQDIFVDGKVPRPLRHQVPLLYRAGACIWAVGVKRSSQAPGRCLSERCLRVEFEPLAGTDS